MIKKLISILISAALIWTSGNCAQAAAISPEIFAAPSNLPQFKLIPPAKLGRIVDYFNGRTEVKGLRTEHDAGSAHSVHSPQSSPLVILIQDLHANYGVQKNIAGLLDFLANRLKVSMGGFLPFALAVEGASGPIDSSLMALFPDEELKEKASQFLMREGELSGAEYFAIHHRIPQGLVGVENEKYYETHRNLFRRTLEDRRLLIQSLEPLKKDLAILARRIYSAPVKRIQSQIEAHDKGELTTEEYIGYLMSYIGPKSSQHRSDLGLGTLDSGQFQKEFPALASFASNAHFGSSESLRAKTSEFITGVQGQLSAEEKKNLQVLAKAQGLTTYYLYLRELVYAHQLFLGVPPELAQYMEYVHTVETLGLDRVLDEARKLAFQLEKRLASSSKEKDFVQVIHDVDMLIDMANLQANEYEVREFAPRLNQFVVLAKALLTTGESASRSVGESEDPDHRLAHSPTHLSFDELSLRRLISASIDFYVMALMRNGPMMDNTLSLLKAGLNSTAGSSVSRLVGKSKADSPTHRLAALPDVAVLVAGGFHTSQLTSLLRERNVSYLVMTPTVDSLTPADQALYIKRLNGELLTPEEIFDRAERKTAQWRRHTDDPLAPETALTAGIFGTEAFSKVFLAAEAVYFKAGHVGVTLSQAVTHVLDLARGTGFPVLAMGMYIPDRSGTGPRGVDLGNRISTNQPPSNKPIPKAIWMGAAAIALIVAIAGYPLIGGLIGLGIGIFYLVFNRGGLPPSNLRGQSKGPGIRNEEFQLELAKLKALEPEFEAMIPLTAEPQRMQFKDGSRSHAYVVTAHLGTRRGAYYFYSIQHSQYVIVLNENKPAAVRAQARWHDLREIALRLHYGWDERTAHIVTSAEERQRLDFAAQGELTPQDREWLMTASREELLGIVREPERLRQEHRKTIQEAIKRRVNIDLDAVEAYERLFFNTALALTARDLILEKLPNPKDQGMKFQRYLSAADAALGALEKLALRKSPGDTIFPRRSLANIAVGALWDEDSPQNISADTLAAMLLLILPMNLTESYVARDRSTVRDVIDQARRRLRLLEEAGLMQILAQPSENVQARLQLQPLSTRSPRVRGRQNIQAILGSGARAAELANRQYWIQRLGQDYEAISDEAGFYQIAADRNRGDQAAFDREARRITKALDILKPTHDLAVGEDDILALARQMSAARWVLLGYTNFADGDELREASLRWLVDRFPNLGGFLDIYKSLQAAWASERVTNNVDRARIALRTLGYSEDLELLSPAAAAERVGGTGEREDLGGNIQQNFSEVDRQRVLQRRRIIDKEEEAKIAILEDIARRLKIEKVPVLVGSKTLAETIVYHLRTSPELAKLRTTYLTDANGKHLLAGSHDEPVTTLLAKAVMVIAERPLTEFSNRGPLHSGQPAAIQAPWRFLFGDGDQNSGISLLDGFFRSDGTGGKRLLRHRTQAVVHEALEAITPNAPILREAIHHALINQIQRPIFGQETDEMGHDIRATIDETSHEDPYGLEFRVPESKTADYKQKGAEVAHELSLFMAPEEISALVTAVGGLQQSFKNPFDGDLGKRVLPVLHRVLGEHWMETFPIQHLPYLFDAVSNTNQQQFVLTKASRAKPGVSIYFSNVDPTYTPPFAAVQTGQSLMDRGILVANGAIPDAAATYIYSMGQGAYIPWPDNEEMVIGYPRDPARNQSTRLVSKSQATGYRVLMLMNRHGSDITIQHAAINPPQLFYEDEERPYKDWARSFNSRLGSNVVVQDVEDNTVVPKAVAQRLYRGGQYRDEFKIAYDRARQALTAIRTLQRQAQGEPSTEILRQIEWQQGIIARALNLLRKFPNDDFDLAWPSDYRRQSMNRYRPLSTSDAYRHVVNLYFLESLRIGVAVKKAVDLTLSAPTARRQLYEGPIRINDAGEFRTFEIWSGEDLLADNQSISGQEPQTGRFYVKAFMGPDLADQDNGGIVEIAEGEEVGWGYPTNHPEQSARLVRKNDFAQHQIGLRFQRIGNTFEVISESNDHIQVYSLPRLAPLSKYGAVFNRKNYLPSQFDNALLPEDAAFTLLASADKKKMNGTGYDRHPFTDQDRTQQMWEARRELLDRAETSANYAFGSQIQTWIHIVDEKGTGVINAPIRLHLKRNAGEIREAYEIAEGLHAENGTLPKMQGYRQEADTFMSKIGEEKGGMFFPWRWYQPRFRAVIFELLTAIGIATLAFFSALLGLHDLHLSSTLLYVTALFLGSTIAALSLPVGFNEVHARFNPVVLKGDNGKGVEAMTNDSAAFAAVASAAIGALFFGLTALAVTFGLGAAIMGFVLFVKHDNLNESHIYSWSPNSIRNQTMLQQAIGAMSGFFSAIAQFFKNIQKHYAHRSWLYRKLPGAVENAAHLASAEGQATEADYIPAVGSELNDPAAKTAYRNTQKNLIWRKIVNWQA